MSLVEVQGSAERIEPLGGDVLDYVALMKPRVMSLVVFTALVGIVAAPGAIHPVLALAALICIAVGAGAAGALNMWYDADIDAHMARTAGRPIVRGRVTAEEALGFGAVLAVGSVVCLGVMANWLAAFLLGFTIAYYLFFYTMWLKRRTPQNIVIGGAAGAFPPIVGWAAASNSIGLEPIVMFLIIFLWTPPHFWALSLYRVREYERVAVPMLPVVAGLDETRRQILLYSIVLVLAAAAPVFLGYAGMFYAASSTALGAVFLYLAYRVYSVGEGSAASAEARRLFSYSLFYLFLLFAALLVEQTLGWAA